MKRSDPRRGAILVTVLWSIALLSALAMAASVTFRGFAGVMAVERDRVQADALLSAGLETAAGIVDALGDAPLVDIETRVNPARDVMLRDAQAGSAIAILPPGAEVSADVSRAARNSFVVLEFPADKVVMRHITPDTIRLQATLDMNLKALRAFLHQLESGTPHVFVDALTVQPAGAMAGRAVEDPLLRTTLSLRAFWRRGTP